MHLFHQRGPLHDFPETPEANSDVHVFAVRYGLEGTFTATFESEGAGPTSRT